MHFLQLSYAYVTAEYGCQKGWATHGLTHSKQTWVGDGHTQIINGPIGLKINFTHGLTGPNQMGVGLAQKLNF